MSINMLAGRRFPIGAELVSGKGVHFRVWAPKTKKVEVILEDKSSSIVLTSELNGYFAGFAPDAASGSLYRFRLDGEGPYPDPASRFQPAGPHGPSMVVDPSTFHWSDASWEGIELRGQVIYELHFGTFTEAGTYRSAIDRLPALKDLGITTVEMMPLADFPGEFNWGYDGVSLFAPSRAYGTPDDLRAFVDRAHALELGVILDVVYNHVGPDGNYLAKYSKDYFSSKYSTEWGEATNFDGDNAAGTREFFAFNGAYWISEYHLDGLRLDATQQIFDASPRNILEEIGILAREAAGARKIIIVCESERQDARLARSIAMGGFGLDAVWNDDFHHSAAVALTGRNEAYYTDYLGKAQEFVSSAKYGTLYQGQYYSWQKQRRGSPALDLPPSAFINYLENHDQVANSGRGERLHQRTSPGRFRAMTALFLLLPSTPMLFQGQEFNSSAPFLFFADHNSQLAPLVRQGRAEFLSQFPSLALDETAASFADPSSRETFQQCKLRWAELESNTATVQLHTDLLRLRREDPVFAAQRTRGIDGAVLSDHAFVIRYFEPLHGDRLLIVNLGGDLTLHIAPEPLLAAPAGTIWRKLWSSDEVIYGGCGVPEPKPNSEWRITGESAVVLGPVVDPRPPYSEQG